MALIKWLKEVDVDAIWSNDLDTLYPAVKVGEKRGLPVVYDSHEFFTEAAGLTNAPIEAVGLAYVRENDSSSFRPNDNGQ